MKCLEEIELLFKVQCSFFDVIRAKFVRNLSEGQCCNGSCKTFSVKFRMRHKKSKNLNIYIEFGYGHFHLVNSQSFDNNVVVFKSILIQIGLFSFSVILVQNSVYIY